MTPSSSPAFLVSGVILAGGRATRMGGDDKGWVPLAGTPLIQHVLTRLRPQVDEVLINANRSQARYRQLAPVIGDAQADFQGPLAGMLAGRAGGAAARGGGVRGGARQEGRTG
uniref:NTP transferase domain-containing protein n=1 Tax=Aeromonas caviae TaxID=648 RepID=UPI0013A58EA9